MNTHQINLVKESWLSVTAIDQLVVGNLFYTRLFDLDPQLRPLFRSPLPEQSKKLLTMLNYVIKKLDALDEIIAEVRKLAQRHVHYGTKPEHYNVVGSALVWTLEQGLGEAWTEELQEAWIAVYTVLAGAMIEAADYAPVA